MNTTATNEVPQARDFLKEYEGVSPTDIIKKLGGEGRGAISTAIRVLAAQGASKGVIAKLIDRRFQHVRNVLHNDAQNAKRPRTTAATPAPITLPVVSIQHSTETETETETETKSVPVPVPVPVPATPAQNKNQNQKAGQAGQAGQTTAKGFVKR